MQDQNILTDSGDVLVFDGIRQQIGSAQLVAVSKKQPPEKLRTLYKLGQRDFAESYVQEAQDKMAHLQDIAITWHFIGALQSNKTRIVAEHFDWVQSVDRLRIANRLSVQRPEQLPDLNILLQVNIANESGKRGIVADEVLHLARRLDGLPRLRLRGLMAIPLATQDVDVQYQQFKRLHDLYQQGIQAGFHWDTLSMGMSGDYLQAIRAGSTMVRIGTALFGARK